MKKRILHLQLLPLLSGVQRFSLHLLDGLPKDKYEIFVAGKAGGEFDKAVKGRGWSFIPIKSLVHPISPLDILALLEIFYILKRYRFDIVHTNSSKPGLLGRLAAYLAKTPKIVHTVHGTSYQEHQKWLTKRLYMSLEKLGNSLGHSTVFVNDSDREGMLKLGLIRKEKALSIFNAMPDEAGYTEPVKKEIQPDEIIIGSTLRFSRQKNVIRLISAIAKAAKQERRLKFIILGDGEHLSLCQRIVASHRQTDKVILPGWDSDVMPWLKLFDAFILYSRWEAMPFSIIEAMRQKLPVIGSDIPSISELVNEDNGWLVPLDDEDKLIKTLVSLADKRDEIREKGENAYRFIRQKCDYQKMVSSYIQVYESDALR